MEASSRFLNTELIDRHKAGLNGQLVEKDRDNLFKSITENLAMNNATLISHYYVDPLIHEITEETNGFIGDSLEMAKFGSNCHTKNLIVCGVKFMAETAKIVSPNKTVLHPSPDAGCSLSDSIEAEDVIRIREENPGVPVVCYINTSAAVKAECDVCVTSSNYLRICESLPGDRLIFVPDKFMGRHLQNSLRGKKEVVLYDGECEVHAEFTGPKIRNWNRNMSENGIDLKVLSHPECDSEVLEMSDFVGSSELLMNEAKRLASIGKKDMMLITECGTADRVLAETEDNLNLMGACVMCRHRKKTQLEDILQALIDP